MSEDNPIAATGMTVKEFIEAAEDHGLTEKQFVDALVGAVVGGLIAEALFGGGGRCFRLYDWCFKHIDQWEIRCERKYIEHYSPDPPRISRINIPGIKLTKRPRKPK